MAITKKQFPSHARDDAEEIRIAWERLDRDVLGQIHREELIASINEFDRDDDEVNDLRNRLSAAISRRKNSGARMWENTKLSREGAIATYGRDSVEYHSFGGTRVSDRKSGLTYKKKQDDTTENNASSGDNSSNDTSSDNASSNNK